MEHTNQPQEVPVQQPQHPAQLQPLPPVFEKRAIQTQQQAVPQLVQYAPFQPPPGFAQQQLEQENQKPRPWSKPWHLAKIALGTASIITSVILWAVSIVLIAKYSGGVTYDYFEVVFEAAWALTVGGIALIWITADFLTTWASKTNHGITPGANVGLHLIIWLLAALAVGFTATFLAWDVELLDRYNTGYYENSNYSYYGYDDIDFDALSAMVKLVETLVAFLGILFLIHFVLFVRACVETNQYNKWRRGTRTVYVHVPMPMGPGQQPYGYYTPMPGQQQMMMPQPGQQMAYQPVPGQQPMMMMQQPPQQMQGGPAAPGQAHLYGYYAPAPVSTQQAPPARTANPPAQAASPIASGSQ